MNRKKEEALGLRVEAEALGGRGLLQNGKRKPPAHSLHWFSNQSLPVSNQRSCLTVRLTASPRCWTVGRMAHLCGLGVATSTLSFPF